ncbi:MAG TPA: topoisomerase C-terminal repeat-containing protein, partial [Stellaceae bacterium]|nr:topoisomerase C-terminal repeat-containing protein [Stellaceae bacterium]
NYPECRYTRALGIENGGEGGELTSPRELGTDPASGLGVSLRKGPYGIYVQLGEGLEDEKPKRVSLPKGVTPADVDLAAALKLLALPRDVGAHPEDGKIITAGIGRFGPYIKHGDAFRSLPAGDDVLTVGLNRAVSILAEPRKFGRAARTPVRVVGKHPADGADINVYSGRYGPYVSHDGINATLPRETTPETVSLDEAVALLAAQAAKGGGKKPKSARPKRAKKTKATAAGATVVAVAKPSAARSKSAKKGTASRAKAASRKKRTAGPTPEAAE